MLYLKTKEEIELIRQSSLLVGNALAEVARNAEPGVKTSRLDKIAEEFIRDSGGIPAFKGYNGFPATLCISVNSQVVHGIPGNYELRDGDIASVDCGVLMNGFYGDSAYTFAIGEVKPEIIQLLKVTCEALYKGIEMAMPGKKVGDVSYAIQSYVEKHNYSVVRELVGHGIGKKLHEAPEVPNYGRKESGPDLQEGLVIAVEPMINLGRQNVIQERDGWTIRTADGKPSAHFEHTIAIRKDGAEILSTFEFIEQVLLKKSKEVL